MDILAKLNRLLITTPDGAYAVLPAPRADIAAAASEIARLRQHVARLESIGSELVAMIVATTASENAS